MSAYNHARPPSPGDDASPFLLRVYVTRRVHWRPMAQFEHGSRPTDDEFKLYVWRSTTLRSLAHMLHAADPTLSKPLSPHSFRLVYYNSHTNRFAARELGRNVTRISLRDVAARSSATPVSKATLDSRIPGAQADAEAYLSALLPPSAAQGAPSSPPPPPRHPSSPPRRTSTAADGGDGSMKLSEFDIVDGDLIECMIRPVPPRATHYHASSPLPPPRDFGSRQPTFMPACGGGGHRSRDALAVRPPPRGHQGRRGYEGERERDAYSRGPPRGRGNFGPVSPPASARQLDARSREEERFRGGSGRREQGRGPGYDRSRQRELSPAPRGRNGTSRSRERDGQASRGGQRGKDGDGGGDKGRSMDVDVHDHDHGSGADASRR